MTLPADTAANRIASSIEVFWCPATVTTGTGTEAVTSETVLPSMSGTGAINWDGSGTGTGTADSWRRIPGIEDLPKVVQDNKMEEFVPAHTNGVPIASDLIYHRIKEVSMDSKETSLTTLSLGFGTSLNGSGTGYTDWNPPTANTDIPVVSLALVGLSPISGKKTILYIPRAQRSTAPVPEHKKSAIRIQTITFDVLGYAGTGTDLAQGQTFRIVQQTANA